jgi:glycosyltransferase involved in cell wall biosynthesis
MKVLLVIHGFPPHQTAGSEIYTYMLAKQLAAKDDVTVLTRAFNRDLIEYHLLEKKVDKFTVISINNTLKYRKSYTDKYINHQIGALFRNILADLKPDVIHIGHLIGLSTTIIDEAKRFEIPIVYTLHDFWLICPTGRFIKDIATICYKPSFPECKKCLAPQLIIDQRSSTLIRFSQKFFGRSKSTLRLYSYLEKIYKYASKVLVNLTKDSFDDEVMRRQAEMQKVLDLVDCFIAPSKFLMQKYTSYGLDHSKVIYLDYGFDRAPFKNMQNKASANLRLGYIGTLIPPKGIHVLLDAFLRIESNNIELRIHGDFDNDNDEYKSYSNRIKARFKRKNIHWYGRYENRNVNAILSEIDILIVPSIWFENSPLVIHEAFLSKTPVITSKAGGMEEMVQHNINGLLFELGNDEDLKRQILRIIDQPDLLNRFKTNLPDVTDIKKHSMDIRKIYNQTINSKKDGLSCR